MPRTAVADDRADAATAVSMVSVTGDRQVAYAEYGPADGLPVVFLHGTPGSRRLGRLLAGAANTEGYRVLAPDRPGYGRSPAWPDRTLADAARVVTAVLDDAAVESAPLVGFSGGAAAALVTAADRPGRVDGVALVSGAVPPAVSEATPRTQRVLAHLARTVPGVLGGLLRGQAWLAARLGPSVVVSQYTASDGTVPADVARVVAADFREAVATGGRGTVTDLRTTAGDWPLDLESVTNPVHLWHGTADTNVPIADARRLASRLPRAELRACEGCDHLQTLVRRPADVLAALPG